MINRKEFEPGGNHVRCSRRITAFCCIVTLVFILTVTYFTGGTRARAEALSFPRFNDIKGHWAEQDIYHLASKGLVSGRVPGSFSPQSPVTRAEFAKLLIGALGLSSVAQDMSVSPRLVTYVDVGSTHWARAYIALARELGLVKGYSDGAFHPEDYITRAEIATMLARAINLLAGEPPETFGTGLEREGDSTGGSTLSFRDSASIPLWAGDAISVSCKRGILRGYPDSTFRPGALTTRAEAVTMLKRLLVLSGNSYDVCGVVVDKKPDPQFPRSPSEGGTTDDGKRFVLLFYPYSAIGLGEAGVFGPDYAGAESQKNGESADYSSRSLPVELVLNKDTMVYRNGKRGNSSQILPLDEVFVVLGPTREALYVDTRFVSEKGVFERYDPITKEIYFRNAVSGGPANPPDAPVRSVVMSDAVAVVRNGKTSSPDNLRLWDEVYLVFNSITGRVRAVNAECFDTEGIVFGIDARRKNIVFRNERGQNTLSWTEESILFRGKERIAFESLKVKERLRLALDESGAVSYAEVVDEVLDGQD